MAQPHTKVSFQFIAQIWPVLDSSGAPMAKKLDLETRYEGHQGSMNHLVMNLKVPVILRRREALGDGVWNVTRIQGS